MPKTTATASNTAKLNIYQVVTDRIVASLRNGITPRATVDVTSPRIAAKLHPYVTTRRAQRLRH